MTSFKIDLSVEPAFGIQYEGPRPQPYPDQKQYEATGECVWCGTYTGEMIEAMRHPTNLSVNDPARRLVWMRKDGRCSLHEFVWFRAENQ